MDAIARWKGLRQDSGSLQCWFGLVYRKESGQVVHSMVAVLIGPDGKLMHLYLRNEWLPKDVPADLR